MLKFINFSVKSIIIFFIVALFFLLSTLWYFSIGLPDYKKLSNYQPPISSRVYSDDGKLIAEYAIEKRLFVPYDSIPTTIINSFLSFCKGKNGVPGFTQSATGSKPELDRLYHPLAKTPTKDRTGKEVIKNVYSVSSGPSQPSMPYFIYSLGWYTNPRANFAEGTPFYYDTCKIARFLERGLGDSKRKAEVPDLELEASNKRAKK